MVARFIASSCSLTRPFRLALVLITLLLTLPQTAWGDSYFVINTTGGGKWVSDTDNDEYHYYYTDFFGDGKMSYDATTNILTLNGINLSLTGGNSDAYFIACNDADHQSLTVRLIGNNNITLGDNNGFLYGTDFSFITDATSPGSLTITTTNWSGHLYEGYYSSEKIDVSYCDKLRKVDGQNTYTIQTVEPTGTSYGLTVAGTPVTSSNATDVLGNGGKVTFDNDNSKLSFTSRNYINYPGHCINTTKSLEISVGESNYLELSSTGSGNYPFYSASDVQIQFNSDFNATIQGKNVPAFSPKCVPYFPVYSPNSTQTGPQITYSDNGYKIKKYTGTDFLEFRIDGNYITSENKSNILGDGSVSFADGTGSGTLSLNNANIGEVRYSGDYANLTINLTGTNYITKRFLDSFLLCYYDPSATNDHPTLTFTGNGELRLQTDDVNFTSADYDFVVDENGGTTDNVDYSANFTTGGWSKEFISAANSANGKPYLRIYKETPIAYGITIAGIPVTSANAGNVLNDVTDPRVVFTPATDSNPTNTLTLHEAVIGDANTPPDHGITVTNLANLTIICTGEESDSYSEIYSTSSPIYCTDASCDLTFTSEQGRFNYIQFYTSATSLVEGFHGDVTYVADKAEQFLPQKQIGFITYNIRVAHNQNGGDPSLNTKTRTFNTSLLNSANFPILSSGGFTFDPATCTITIQDGTKFGRFADAQQQQDAVFTEIQWGVDADLKVVINGDCQIIGGNSYSPFRNFNFNASTPGPNTGRKISFEKGTNATNVNLALVAADSTKAVLMKDFASVSLSNDLKWVSGLPNDNSASLTTNCDITVGGVPITVAEGKGGITAGTGKIYFDGATKKMTMNGATVGGQIVSNLDELTIEFIGANSAYYISSTNTNAPLTITSGTGTNTLSLASGSYDISAVNGFASVTLDGAYLKTEHGTSYVSGNTRAYKQTPGIDQYSYIAYNIEFTTVHYYPLWLNGTIQVYEGIKDDIYEDGQSTIRASFAPGSNTLTMNGLSIDSEFGIESGLSSLTINLIGENSINTNTAYHYNPIYSHVATAPLVIQKAEGAASAELQLSSSSNDPQVIKGFASVTHTGLNFSSKTGSTISDASTKDAILTSATIYPLWVGGNIVTETRTSGTGWSYDNDQKKLTLTNYSKTDNDGHAFISNMANLNVYLVGTNTVSKQALSSGKAFYTTYTDATLTFSTDDNNMGTLDASGYDTFCEGFRTVNGIYCNNGLGYYPSSREIKAKATPTIKFAKRNQGTGDELSPTQYVEASETLQTAIGYVFKAPNPTFDNGVELFPDTTRYVYSYSVDGVVEFPTTGTNSDNPTRTDYGEINLLKAGTVTITCTFPGNMQNNPCSASYTLQVDKAILILSGTNTTNTACICVDGSWHWGNAPDNYFPAPDITIPNDVTAFTYSSSNTDVATVNSTTGEITPVGPGSATITLYIVDDPKYQDTDYPIDLTVMVPATISFANATASMSNTETYTQTATTVPTGATIVYSSSNNDVNVDANGEVTINNSFYGTATITATVTAVPAANPQYYYVQSNNAAFQATYKLTVSKVFNDVTFANGQNYATYYNENEDMTVPEGLTAYLVTGTSGNSVVTYPVNYLAKSVPLLLEKSTTAGSTLTNTIYSGTELTNAEKSSNLLQYADGDQDVDNLSTAGGTPYVLYKNEFVKATGTIPQNHCYLLITGHAPSRGYYSIGNGNDGSTAIDATHIDNGEMANENWYDLQGRRIERPTKPGLYIRNGKKVVVNNK